ncbi:MAG: sigma-70 family RNA polymerase sigma factor [Acidobacteriota bacterium]
MTPPRSDDITRLLVAWSDGEAGALDQLTPIIYGELHRLARHYLRDERQRSLQTTELVHEAYLRLVGAEVDWHGRGHFYVVAARQMRRILVDMARRRAALKREAPGHEVTLVEGEVAGGPPVDVLALDEALAELATFDERKCRVIELSYFTGLTIPEISQALDISTATVERDLRTGRAWLGKTLKKIGIGSGGAAESEA